MSQKVTLKRGDVEAIAKALGDTGDGLTGSEIGQLLGQLGIEDVNPEITKWKRLYNALIENGEGKGVIRFIEEAMSPQRFLDNKGKYGTLRYKLNKALAFSGMEVKESGELARIEKIKTIREAEERVKKLKEHLSKSEIHEEVWKYCQEEYLQENYFHATFEAVKGIFSRLREMTGLEEDGNLLIDILFCGDNPPARINEFKTPTEKSMQFGFANIAKGTYSMFRNPIAHEAKFNSEFTLEEAEDAMKIASIIHKRIDKMIFSK